jgi:hypothetical protein
MPDVPNPEPITNPIGSPFDPPATADDLGPGQPGCTLFSLLKGCLLYLAALADGTGQPRG